MGNKTMKTQADERLDAQGMYCPVPVIRTAEKMRDLQDGQILEVLATDEAILEDIPAWSKSAGNELLRIERDGTIYRAYLRKGGGRRGAEGE